jgi:hypothetical protein
MKQVVIMPGGFHPFHAGHAALYQSAKAAFPGADVYVAATDDTSTRPFPFQVKEKLAQLAGVDKGRFMRVKSPFQAKEITAPYNPETTQLIFVRSEKDADKPPQAGGVKKNGEPSYLQPYNKTATAPMSQHGYMAYLPTVEFGPGMTSATEIRTAWPKLNEKRKTALVMSLYPKTQSNPKLAATVAKMLDTAIGTEVAENQGWAATYEADGITAGTGVTGGMHATYQDQYNQPVDEAKLHFTDPSTRVNLYYVPPKLQHQGKVQNVAHNIPYSTVQPLIDRLMQKYPNMHAEYLVVGPTDKNEYGQRLREQEQLSGKIRAVRSNDPNQEWDYYYKDQMIEPGTEVHSKIKDLHFDQQYPGYIDTKNAINNAFSNPIKPSAPVPANKWPENQSGADRVVPPPLTVPKQVIKDPEGKPIRLKDFVPHDPDIMEDYVEEDKVDPITSAAVNFYQNEVGDVSTKPVADYKKIARELLQQTENPSMRKKIRDILVQGNKNPYIQGGVITTVGALLAGGILSTASRMGLTPQQTNILLQSVLNTVIPTMVSRVNGKSWRDTLKYTLASAGIGTGIAAMTETGRKK